MSDLLALGMIEQGRQLAEARAEIAKLRSECQRKDEELADLRERLAGWVRAHELRPGDVEEGEDEQSS